MNHRSPSFMPWSKSAPITTGIRRRILRERCIVVRTREYTRLMAQGKKLEEEVATREQGGPEGRDRPEGFTHRL